LDIANNGDISFFEDTGTTAKLTWDASAESLNFADNAKAIFGAGSDLQIYHDGSNSYINDTGTGNLFVRASDNFYVQNAAGTETKAAFTTDGAVKLYYNGGTKFQTVSGGIDVTGTVVSDGAEIIGDVAINTTTPATYLHIVPTDGELNDVFEGFRVSRSTSLKASQFSTYSHAGGSATITSTVTTSAASGSFRVLSSADGSTTKNLLNISNGNDVSFYEDTGTTAKLFWDASAESLGIGTTSPRAVSGYNSLALDGSTSGLLDINTNGTRVLSVYGASNDINLVNPTSTGAMRLYTNDTERMRIDSSGNVDLYQGNNLTWRYAAGSTIRGSMSIDSADNITFSNTSSNTERMRIGSTGIIYVNGDGTGGRISGDGSGALVLQDGNGRQSFKILSPVSGNAQAMTLDASGNLLVGKTGTSFSTAGSRLTPDGGGQFIVNEAACIEVNRLSNDGTLVGLYKDGSSVGSIFNSGTTMGVGSLDTGVLLANNIDAILPWNASTNAERGSAIDLGRATTGQFKNLYLSGFINAGNDIRMNQTNPRIDYDNGSSGSLRFFSTSANTERMRITSSGNLLVGLTSSDYLAADDGIQLNANGTARFGGSGTSARNLLSFVNGTDGTPAEVGFIQTNGSATSYSTSSDQRLKDNIVDAPSASDDIDAIQVRSFDWKADGSHQKYGMVAQELQSVAPEAVSGDADSDDMMGVDYSKLVPMLVKEIQSLRARVAQLEGAN
jgi:hypothetical protein